MEDAASLRAELGAAVSGGEGAARAADRLCDACVELLDVDGAAISVVHRGVTQGTIGSSGELARQLDELQLVLGEGPALDAARGGAPVLVGELSLAGPVWSGFTPAALGLGVRAVFAFPVAVASASIGALDLFRMSSGELTSDGVRGGLWAAELAALPLLAMLEAPRPAGEDESGDGWDSLAALRRVEVYQATGMLIAQLDVDATEALVRLRAHAYSHGLTASEVAWAIIERRLVLDDDARWDEP